MAKKEAALRSRLAGATLAHFLATGGEVTEAERDIIESAREVATRLLRHARTLRLRGVPFYHGGHWGREIGDCLLPSCETGNVTQFSYVAHDRVFVTTSFQTARNDADWVGGVVYRVEPLGEFDVDIASVRAFMAYQRSKRPGDRSLNIAKDRVSQFCCERARVLEGVEVG